MKIREFLREKIYLFVFTFLCSLIIFFFLFAIRVTPSIIVIIEFLVWSIVIVVLCVEYGRRYSFYKVLDETLAGLEHKYLITEIIEEPQFADGKMLFETLRDVDKSMADHVHIYRDIQNDYKSYIEMWVHEVKTPLAAAKLILDNKPTAVSESLCEEIEKIESFVEQALFYARSSNPEKDYIIKKIPLQESVNRVIRKHSKSFIYKKMRIEIKDIDTFVYSDTKWLEFILDQIIGNALKYMPQENGLLQIFCEQVENAVYLHIKDNGIGIASHELPRIFDKGFTGSNGRTNEKATGIGLYLCKTLCDKLYLNIQASSIQREGTTITITFPISKLMLLK